MDVELIRPLREQVRVHDLVFAVGPGAGTAALLFVAHRLGLETDAAWKKISKADRPYLSVTLNDPLFPATIYARLIEGGRTVQTI